MLRDCADPRLAVAQGLRQGRLATAQPVDSRHSPKDALQMHLCIASA